jgi:hypothetical protein
MCIYFYYYFLSKDSILINKVIIHNRVHDPYYKIKYLNLHQFLDFSSLVFSYH